MVWLFSLLCFFSTVQAEESSGFSAERVPISAEFYGARFKTHVIVTTGAPLKQATAPEILHHNALRLKHMTEWIEKSSDRFDFNDYGRFQLVVETIDAMGIQTINRTHSHYRPIEVALERGRWTTQDRLLAIGGGLEAIGYNVAVFRHPRMGLLLGLGTQDPDLNVDSIQEAWTIRRDGVVRNVNVEWMLWNGTDRLGHMKDFEKTHLNALKNLESVPPTGEYFSFMERKTPQFTKRNPKRIHLPVSDSDETLTMTHHPHVADWYARYPQFAFERQVQFVQDEMALLNLKPSIRRLAARADSEEDFINQLLRTLQTQFKYQEGPLRSMDEVLQSRHADCDQLSMMMLIALRTVGYTHNDVVSVRWPGHLALGIRAKRASPEGSVLNLKNGQYAVLDTTNYIYRQDKLVSRWGATSDKYGASVTVGSLDAMKRKRMLTH